jgi:hypothetical protein
MVAGVIVALVVGTFAVRTVTFDHRLAEIDAGARASVFAGVVSVDTLVSRCDDLAGAARRAGTNLVVFRVDVRLPYACAAEHYPGLETLYPRGDRRTWLLHDENRQRRSRIIVGDADAAWCDNIRGMVASCAIDPATPGAAIVDFRAQPVVELWRRLGEPVRSFDRG